MMLMLPVLFPALFLGLQYTPSLNRRLPCVRMSASDIDGAVQVSKLPTAAQLCSAADEEVAGLTDLVWTAICGQAAAASSSPVLAPFFQTTISSQSTLPKALARVLARKIALDGLTLCYPLADELACIFGEPAVCKLITSDLLAVVEADPAAPELLTVLLHFKGFLALQAHRAAHQLWARENDAAARQLALLLQGRASELFGVDIHPGASIGGATFIDHASGIVIGEQAAMRPKPRAISHAYRTFVAARASVAPPFPRDRSCNPHRCAPAATRHPWATAATCYTASRSEPRARGTRRLAGAIRLLAIR